MKKTLVVGAGPAGSACAWRLAKDGIGCILVDKSEFPRPKICGGVLSSRAVGILEKSGLLSPPEIDDLTISTHTTMTIFSDLMQLRTWRSGDPPVRLIDRRTFDAFLRRRAAEEGAELLTDQLTRISGNEAVFASGRRISFHRIIGADGAGSRVHRFLLGGKAVPQCPAISTVIPFSAKAVELFKDKGLQIHFLSDLNGYAWIFPRQEDIVAGIGSFKPPHPPLEEHLKRILASAGLGRTNQFTGATLPAGNQVIDTGKGRVLLVGDAAGLCDRVSGEGISSALESGLLAANAVISQKSDWAAGAQCVQLVKQSLKYRKFLYSRPFRNLAIRALRRSDRWYARYWSIISGSSDYKGLFRV